MSKKDPSVLLREGEETQSSQSVAGCFTHLAWNIGGSAALVILWAIILRVRPWTLTIWDALYWVVVLGMIGARYLDYARFGGLTGTGEPSTARNVRNYAAGLIAVSAVLWSLAQVFET